MRVPFIAAALTLAVSTAAAASFDPRDSWELYKRLEPADAARCPDRHCPRQQGGMQPGIEPNSFSQNVAIAGADPSVRLYYKALDCNADKAACRSLAMVVNYTYRGDIKPDRLARFVAANPACGFAPHGRLYGPSRAITLTATTKRAEIEKARTALLVCEAKFRSAS